MENLEELLAHPRESLDVELKQWLDPTNDAHQAKIVRACLALHNNNGGYLIVGFKDDGTPDSNVPQNVRESFHVDKMQELVSRYAWYPFPIRVEFVKRDGVEYPVICLDGDLKTPVATKRGLPDSTEKNRFLIRENTVYVRSLQTNGRVSSCAAKGGDWERIVKLCFDNREADIGAFFRRHLSGGNVNKFLQLEGPIEQAKEILNAGRQRFLEICPKRNVTPNEFGTREVAVKIDGDVPSRPFDAMFLSELLAKMPDYSGWPPWIDTRNVQSEDSSYAINDGWETFAYLTVLSEHLDFWQLKTGGRFYHIRPFEDDLRSPETRRPEPRQGLDYYLQVCRTVEVIAAALSFARTMGCDEETTSLAFVFRWSGLNGRHLSSWASRERIFRPSGTCHENEKVTEITVPLAVPASAIATFVQSAVAPLFLLFGGKSFADHTYETITGETLGRRC